MPAMNKETGMLEHSYFTPIVFSAVGSILKIKCLAEEQA